MQQETICAAQANEWSGIKKDLLNRNDMRAFRIIGGFIKGQFHSTEENEDRGLDISL